MLLIKTTAEALTDLGRKLAAVPVHPMRHRLCFWHLHTTSLAARKFSPYTFVKEKPSRYAYCLHVSLEFECVAEILSRKLSNMQSRPRMSKAVCSVLSGIVALMSADAQIFTTSKKQRSCLGLSLKHRSLGAPAKRQRKLLLLLLRCPAGQAFPRGDACRLSQKIRPL